MGREIVFPACRPSTLSLSPFERNIRINENNERILGSFCGGKVRRPRRPAWILSLIAIFEIRALPLNYTSLAAIS